MINTKRLRLLVGVLGMLLPIIVLIQYWCIEGRFPASVSITYFTESCVASFMIALGAAGILLISYRGYELIDDIINSLAGIFGIGVCLFPTYPPSSFLLPEPARVGAFLISPNISSTLHNICAVGFFGLLIFNSMFLFTKTAGRLTPEKKKRNWVYRICAIGMLLSVALCFFLPMVNAVWIGEMFALFFFGISWLTKADCLPFLFKDKN